MWAKRGIQPKIHSAPTQEKVAFHGFINARTGELFTCECDTFNYETFMDAVTQFRKESDVSQKICVVLDNASWHKKGVRLMKENKEISNHCEFLFLPPYSPELNPIERVWRITRKERTHNKYFHSLPILKDVLLSYFSKFCKPNEKFQSLCANI